MLSVTDDASFTSPMVTIFACISKCFIIDCFAGVSYTALPEYKQLIYSDVPSWNTSLFVWTVDILILFPRFSCFHCNCHLCHHWHHHHHHHHLHPPGVSTVITIATIKIINRNSSKLNQCLHYLNYLHLHIHFWL